MTEQDNSAHTFVVWVLCPILMITGILSIIDPNDFVPTRSSGSSGIYTSGRALGCFFVILGGIVFTTKFTNTNYVVGWLKVSVPVSFGICGFSGLFSAVYGYCWGFFENGYFAEGHYIYIEYFWLVFSFFIAPVLYFWLINLNRKLLAKERQEAHSNSHQCDD